MFNATGRKIGDVELTGRYQLNDGGPNEPYYIASLRFKMRTGSDQFDFPSVYVPNSGYLPKGLPTGSGFYSLQPGVTFLFPSDPVVFFGGINYQYSFGRSNLSLRGRPEHRERDCPERRFGTAWWCAGIQLRDGSRTE